MTVEIIQDPDGFAALRDDWERVHRLDPDAGYFLSWRWLDQVFRSDPGRWKVLAVRGRGPGKGYDCFLPLSHHTHWSESGQRFKTEMKPAGKLAWAQYTGFVCDPAREVEALAEIAAYLAGAPWARISFKHDGCRRRLDLLLDAFSDPQSYRINSRPMLINNGTVDNLICPRLSLPGDFDLYAQSRLSSKTRQKLRRFWRRYERSDALRITDSTPDRFLSDLDALLGMWLVRWAPARGEKSALRAAAKYREFLDLSHRIDAIRLSTLWHGDKRLGAMCSIVDHDAKYLYFIVSGRDETAREPNIGLLLHTHTIKWAIANGVKTYDFCHGNEAYKISYGAVEHTLSNVEIVRRSSCDVAQLNPDHLGDAMRQTIEMIESERTDAAASACRQLLPLIA
ncbi:GNAT family N-acetyltransferase [Roseibium sp.]|uniref:GNAT family N-acetyltransferase n=1 Tax=Roseibium sp. TaxID=1936156 RepID=UPI003BA8AA78